MDNEFIIKVETKEFNKIYLIGKDIFISKSTNDEDWELDAMDISDMIHDGVRVASLVDELKELNNTYVVAHIVDMYLRGYSLKKTRDLILKEIENI